MLCHLIFKLLKANCGNEEFYQFILGSTFFALVFYMILTLAKHAWNFFMSMITRDKDLQNKKKERIDKENKKTRNARRSKIK